MDPTRQSVPEAGAYQMLRDALMALMTVEHTLAIVEQAAPDPERAAHLHAIRSAIERLVRVVPGSPD